MGDKHITYKDDNLEFIYHNKIYDIDDINPLLEQYLNQIYIHVHVLKNNHFHHYQERQ